MNLQLISDLHTECYSVPLDLAKQIAIVPNLDFLVIAGDLVVPMRQLSSDVKDVFDHFSRSAKHVIYVEGNHEYYGGSCEPVNAAIREALPDNFIWLRNSVAEVGGLRFYGGTMWFPNSDQLDCFYRRDWADFEEIAGLTQWVYECNRQFTEKAHHVVDGNTIVVTHHLPHYRSVPLHFAGSSTNRFFVSVQTKLIEQKQPRLWLHGHTHKAADYMLGDTRVVCNPYGYPQQRRGKPYTQVVLEI